MTRLLTTLAAACGVFAIIAEAQACPAVPVEADAVVLARWPQLPEQIGAAFAGRDDVDTCARVHLEARDGAVALSVSLPDGRSASRVERPDSVISALEALLLIPAAAEPPESSPSAPAAGTASTQFQPFAIAVARETPPAVVAPRTLGIELSLGASLRRGDGQSSAGLGASSFLEVAGWLAGFGARIDSYGGGAGGRGDSPALEVEVLAGRRFRLGSFTLDAATGPAFALRGGWSVKTANGAASEATSPVRSSTSDGDLVPRWVTRGRLNLGARSMVRTFVGIEGEFGAAGPIPPGTMRGLPAWTFGSALGVTVGTL